MTDILDTVKASTEDGTFLCRDLEDIIEDVSWLISEVERLRQRHAEEDEYWFAAGWTAARRTKPAEYQETEHALQHDAYLSEARKGVARDEVG